MGQGLEWYESYLHTAGLLVVVPVVAAQVAAQAFLRGLAVVAACREGRVVVGGLAVPCLLLLLASTAVEVVVAVLVATAARVAATDAVVEAWVQNTAAVAVVSGLVVAPQALLRLQ